MPLGRYSPKTPLSLLFRQIISFPLPAVHSAALGFAKAAVVMIANQVLRSLRFFLPINPRVLLLFPRLIQ
jgi:hypothetical protein